MTIATIYAKIRPCLLKRLKSLLPKRVSYRDALIRHFPNIEPRLRSIWLRRLIITSFSILVLLGYQPIVQFPPVRQAKALASEQQQEIVAEEFPNLALPHPGYLSTKFSQWHPGVDLATGLGMPVRPIAEGVVEEVNIWLWGYGNHVIISHSRGLKSLYGHLGRIYVKKGQIVSQNTVLGEVGLTGHTSGPHTHLEIQKDGQNIDPLTILPPVASYPSPEILRPVGGDQTKSDLVKTLKPDFN